MANRSQKIYFDDIPIALPYSNGLFYFRRPIFGNLLYRYRVRIPVYHETGSGNVSMGIQNLGHFIYQRISNSTFASPPLILYLRNSGLHSPLRHLKRPLLRLITSYKP